MATSSKNHIRALTSLRFFAAFLVLVYHAGADFLIKTVGVPVFVENFLKNGFLGVSFFFILSGFILTYVYSDKIKSKENLKKYGLARFARVYPVYLLSLLMIIPFSQASGLVHDAPQFFLLQYWMPYEQVENNLLANWNAPAWTLSVELFFYLIFPFIIPHINRMSLRTVLLSVAGIIATIFVFRAPSFFAADGFVSGYIPVPIERTPEFILGTLLGTLHIRKVVPRSPAILYACMIMSVIAMSASQASIIQPVTATCFAGIILFTTTSLEENWLARLLNSNLLVLLGGASYVLYLCQVPVRMWMEWMFAGSGYETIVKLIYIPVMILFSVLVFLFYEEKMRGLIRKFFSAKAARAQLAKSKAG